MSTSKPSSRLNAFALVALASIVLATGFVQTASANTVNAVSFPATPTSNPGNLNMYEYVPTAPIPAGARPLVMLLPGCGQTAIDFATKAGWTQMADLKKFYLVIAEQKTGLMGNNAQGCFNWFDIADTTRGMGEALSIKQMVDLMKTRYAAALGTTNTKVYVSGLSAGGAMAAVMLATYPDVFYGGAINAGIPYKCATNVSMANSCMGTPGFPALPAKTSTQWGDLARSGFPGWTGHTPKVAIFHGSADTTVTPARMSELKQQWTNYNRVVETPAAGTITTNSTHAFPINTYSVWAPGGGVNSSPVQTMNLPGMAHGVSIEPPGAGDKCGTVAPYVLNAGICTSYYTCQFWGI